MLNGFPVSALDTQALPEEKTDRWKIPNRTAESKYHDPLLSAAVIAAGSLYVAGIYFAAVSEKRRMLPKFLLRKFLFVVITNCYPHDATSR